MKERGLDQAAQSGPGGPLAGMQPPAEGASLSTGTSPSEPSEGDYLGSSFANPGTIWEQHDIGGKLAEAGKFAALGPALGPAAYGASKVADATGLRVDVGFDD